MTKEIDGIAHRADAVYTPQTATPFLPLPRARDLLLFRADVGNAVLTRAVRAGDGFAFDSDTLERLAALWEDLALRYRDAQRETEYLTSAVGPGLDYASVGHAEKIITSGQALKDAFDERARYCGEVRDKLLDALDQYAGAEDEAGSTMAREKGKFE